MKEEFQEHQANLKYLGETFKYLVYYGYLDSDVDPWEEPSHKIKILDTAADVRKFRKEFYAGLSEDAGCIEFKVFVLAH